MFDQKKTGKPTPLRYIGNQSRWLWLNKVIGVHLRGMGYLFFMWRSLNTVRQKPNVWWFLWYWMVGAWCLYRDLQLRRHLYSYFITYYIYSHFFTSIENFKTPSESECQMLWVGKLSIIISTWPRKKMRWRPKPHGCMSERLDSNP